MGICAGKTELERPSSSGTWHSESKARRDAHEKFPFVAEPNLVRNVWKIFKEVKVLGRGANAIVAKVKNRETGIMTAMKVMPKDEKVNGQLFKAEYDILHTLEHGWIVGLLGVYIDRKNYYIQQELLTGGELFDRLRTNKTFTEEEAVVAMRQLFGAVSHMHARDIVHRDLKLENAVYASSARKRLVIIDFGEAMKIKDDQEYDDFVCTPYYVAPELVRVRRGWETKTADVWSLGVCAYSLVCGGPPWWGRDSSEILRQIYKRPLSLPSPLHMSARKAWCDSPIYNIRLSADCRSFLRMVLQKDTQKRPNCNQCLQHKWLHDPTATQPEGPSTTTATVEVEITEGGCGRKAAADFTGAAKGKAADEGPILREDSVRTVSSTNDEATGLIMPTSL